MSFLGEILEWIVHVVEKFSYRHALVAWQAVAERKGLVFDPGTMFRTRSVRGTVEGFGVALEVVSQGKTFISRLTVDARGRIPRDLAIDPEGFAASIRKALGGQDLEIGDGGFDERTLVRGDLDATLAILGAENRRRVDGALACGIRVGKGVLVREWSGFAADPDAIVSTIDRMTALAAALAIRREEVPRRLADRARDRAAEPEALRRRALEALAASYGGHEATIDAARAALSDPSPGIRAAAAAALGGDEGRETLATLALDATIPEGVRARAIESLATRFDAAGARGVVAGLEAAAIALLASPESLVRLAAARALERIGGRDAVEPLLPLGRGLLGNGSEKSAALSAVRAIQARLGPAERGGLSLSHILDAGGALSEPSAPDGGLSLDDRRAGDAEAES